MKKAEKLATKKFGKSAEKISQNKEELKELASKAFEKLDDEKVKGRLGEAFETLTAFLRLIKAYVKGDYRKVGIGTIISIVIAILYFLNPLDLIPDFLFAIGFLDDASVILWTGKKLLKDIEEFKTWETSKDKTDNQNES
ncbi:MAG: DUF1232 domain-containing protein [Bacteriovoracaceae bacterium]|nr:DUF1232 domain-containing protein [Bacteriovoracaceae bacterium]